MSIRSYKLYQPLADGGLRGQPNGPYQVSVTLVKSLRFEVVPKLVWATERGSV